MNLLTLPVGTVIKVKIKEDVEKQHGEGFVGIERYENEYGIIDEVCKKVGCYYIKDFEYGWDDRLVEKVENPIGIYLTEYDGEIISSKYCSKDDIKTKEKIIKDFQCELHEYRKINIEEL